MTKIYDVIIIGGGAAGLMAAALCGKKQLRTLVLERNAELGRKLLITGGGRCNVTHKNLHKADFNGEHVQQAMNIMKGFDPDAVVEFFRICGVELVCQPDGCYFPERQSAATIRDALVNELRAGKVEIQTKRYVDRIEPATEQIIVVAGQERFAGKNVIVATGGCSYAATGSDGNGLAFARRLGHTIIPLIPALTPVVINDAKLRALSGVVVPCRLTLLVDSKKTASFTDDLLFTHFGISGLGVLNISRHWERVHQNKSCILEGCFLPQTTRESWEKEVIAVSAQHPRQSIDRYLRNMIPQRFVDYLLEKSAVDPATTLAVLNKDMRQRIVQSLFCFTFDVEKVYGYEKAEATAGGIDLAELDRRSLESKKMPGVFFVGEMCDVDGRVGGFNLQWAWSSAAAAVDAIRQRT